MATNIDKALFQAPQGIDAAGEGEDAKVAIRNIRRDANHQVKELLKDKQITEDDSARTEAEIQKITDAAIKDVDEVVKGKEQELMAV